MPNRNPREIIITPKTRKNFNQLLSDFKKSKIIKQKKNILSKICSNQYNRLLTNIQKRIADYAVRKIKLLTICILNAS